MALTIYKTKLERVCKINEIPAEVETFLHYHSDYYNSPSYVDCEEDLRDYFGEDEQEQYEIVLKWFNDNNLFGMDIVVDE